MADTTTKTHCRFKRFLASFLGAAGLAALASGCGSTMSPSAPGPESLAPAGPPSSATLKQLLPQNRTIVKTAALTFKGHAPEELVITTAAPRSTSSVLGSLKMSAVTWNSHSEHWRVAWQSPALNLQEIYMPGHPATSAITAWQVEKTAQGALVGLLDAASLGASTIWNDGLIVWMQPHQTPRVLWNGSDNNMLADGALARTSHGLTVSQDGCSGVEAVQHDGHATLSTLSCTDILAKSSGQRIRFTATSNGTIHSAGSSVTVAKGSTVVFWPADSHTAHLVNGGQLELYGGSSGNGWPRGQVPLVNADSLYRWSYHFTQPGRYLFAIVPNSTMATSAPATMTVTVTG
ncbi:cupredoxin domain-containing protein [Sulfobacillus harzensis]|uniref:Uncharacterized protein n=1 Tax=Sulfobacillus harzensis TaxID=2729629 RepID=A0A7Y0L9J0_9FIRM|nr:hypothetical protein [Sulfobacillus harzensis]NMP24429.1 hypothetical protein [Sulfobacillus harzensis]